MNQTNKTHRNFPSFYRDQSGAVAVIVSALAVILLCFIFLAVDIGHIMVVRNELQNAADAAALAGAQKFYSSTISPFPTTPTPPAPDWTDAENEVTKNFPFNYSDGSKLNAYTYKDGYWNLPSHSPTGGSWSQSVTPGANDVPGIQVTVTRASGVNGGPVVNWFSNIIGINTTNVSATATAVEGFTGTVNPGNLLPIVIGSDSYPLYSQYNTATNPIALYSTYHTPLNEGDQAGQWTSFFTGENNSPIIEHYFTNPSSDPTLSIGDSIWIEPGTKTVLFSYVPTGGDYVLPVVYVAPGTTDGLETHADMQIVGFIGFHIISSTGKSTKDITGYFESNVLVGGPPSGVGGSGSYYGTHSPPVLVK